MKAVVMAGGEGSRLRPVTANRPKPLTPVVNRPIMAHIVDLLRRHGITEVCTTLHYLAHEIQAYFGDGSEFGVSMSHFIEDTPLGTAGSVKQAEQMLKDGTFVIISGDALTDIDLTAALEWHRAKGSVATLVLSRVPNPLEFGIVITQEDGRIQRFLEKPGWSEVFSDTVNTGIYILEPEILDRIAPGAVVDWSKDVFPALLAENAPMYGYVMNEYWSDIGTLEQYREAQIHVLQGRTTLPVPGEQIRSGLWVGEGTTVDQDAVIDGPVCLGANCRVKRGSTLGPFTVVGDSCLIEEGATVRRSVLWERCYIGNKAQIDSAILGQQVTIKRDVSIQEDAVIGDRCLLDVGCVVRPRVKVWPDKTIERGSTLTLSLVTGNRWRGNLFRDLGVAGISNIEITPEFATRFAMAVGSTMRPGATFIACRDSARSSRMIKRSVMASLLSTGCQVVDMHGAPVPILRHTLRNIGAAGAINVRKQPGNARLTLMEVMDLTGGYIDRGTERKVESAFFREDFRRIDPDELGRIEDAIQPVEAYARDFRKQLFVNVESHRPRVVVDYGYSSVSPIFPAILAQLGVETISLNSFNDARSAPRNLQSINEHLANLGRIVPNVGYDMGVLVTNEGENLHVVDENGIPIVATSLLALLALTLAKANPGINMAMSVTVPSRLVNLLEGQGAMVTRCRSGVRDLMTAAGKGPEFAGDESGGFIFPALHAGFDAMFALVNLAHLLKASGEKLSDIVHSLPQFHLAYDKVDCPWEAKGKIMRRLTESQPEGARLDLVDGIKVYDNDSWVLILPDSFEPVFHVMAESPSAQQSREMVDDYVERINMLRAGH